MNRYQKIQLGFFLLCILLYSLLIPVNAPEKWQGVDLPFSVLQSRLQFCHQNKAYEKGCNDALTFLEQQLTPEERKKLSHPTNNHLQRFEELKSFLQRRDSKEAEYVAGALNAWMNAFDPHARLVSTQDEDTQLKDRFFNVQGLGVRVRIFKNQVNVGYALEGSAAEESGIKYGDEILSVNGIALRDLSKSEKEKALKAAKSPFQLVIRRENNTLNLTAVEKKYRLENVTYLLHKNEASELTGHIRVRSFAKDSTCKEIFLAVQNLEKRGARSLELDMRDNPGGLVHEAQCAAGLFIGPGKLFARLEKINIAAKDFVPSTPISQWKDRSATLFTDQDKATSLPVRVIINQNTASAAEMFAAALQDDHRAVVYGARSFGKGSMQSAFHPWDDPDLLLFRTTHIIERPSGKVLQYSGVTPDVLTERAEGKDFPREEDLTR